MGPGLSSRQSPPNNQHPCRRPGATPTCFPSRCVDFSPDQLTPVSRVCHRASHARCRPRLSLPRVLPFSSAIFLSVYHLSTVCIHHVPSINHSSIVHHLSCAIYLSSVHPRARLHTLTLAHSLSLSAGLLCVTQEAHTPTQSPGDRTPAGMGTPVTGPSRLSPSPGTCWVLSWPQTPWRKDLCRWD